MEESEDEDDRLRPVSDPYRRQKHSLKSDTSSGRSRKKQRSHDNQTVSADSQRQDISTHSKPETRASRPRPPVQMAIYAGERLSSGIAVRHCIDFLVVGQSI